MKPDQHKMRIEFSELELENLAEFIRECPGRISAAVVPGPVAGEQLLERLKQLVAPISIIIAPIDSSPQKLGKLAIKEAKKDNLLIIPLDGRRDFSSKNQAEEFWESINLQRESLASGKTRTCFILDYDNDQYMIHLADDLREWVRIFRFPGAIPLSDDAGKLMMQNRIAEYETKTQHAPIDVLRDQLKRAREAGFSRDQLARDYAAPLFIALVENGLAKEARKIWERDLYKEDTIPHFNENSRFQIIRSRIRLAEMENNRKDLYHWINYYSKEMNSTGS